MQVPVGDATGYQEFSTGFAGGAGICRDIGEVGQARPGLGRPDEGTVSLLWDKQIKHPGSQEAGSTRTYLEVAGGDGMESSTEFAGMLVATGSFGCQRVVLKCWQFKT